MTNRERMLAILAGKSPDQVPWIPRMKLWHNGQKANGTLPARFKNKSLREVEQALRLGNPAREGRVFRVEYRGMEVRSREDGFSTITEYITPKGTVRFVASQSAEEARLGIEGRITTEHPLKTPKDYDVWAYVAEHATYVPTYKEYELYDREVGDEGLPMVSAGDCPFHYWLKELTGYGDGYIHLHEFPDRVEALLKVMTEKEKEMWKIAADSPAKLFLHGVHLSSQMTPPRYFDKYIVPYYQEFTKLLHAKGKSLAMHADNDTSAILTHLKKAGYDMVECFVSHPMAKVTVEDARKAWGNSMIIYGGIPSLILEEFFPEAEFEAYIKDIFRVIAPGDAFILGIADNAMPGTVLSRIERITEMVDKYGKYPVTAPK